MARNNKKLYNIGALYNKTRRITDAIKDKLVEDAQKLDDLFVMKKPEKKRNNDFRRY